MHDEEGLEEFSFDNWMLKQIIILLHKTSFKLFYVIVSIVIYCYLDISHILL